ncbi:Rib/alpha-like domain-containing protein [Corynebacterium macclintockiae]|uniref:Rib/alpha-like domain-containing protein n=4 Tax=Corynebacterium macclintockiae TaxID=2913501 RepID=UPI003EBB41BE
MMHLRSRRAMIAVAASASMILTASAVPNSPVSPSVAQAATANKTQDTNLPLKCTLFAAGGKANENMDFTGNMHVTMPGEAAVGEVFEASVSMDSLQVQHKYLTYLSDQPSFEVGNTTANTVRFAVKGDVELIDSSLPAKLENGVLTVDKMMQPSRAGDTVTLAFAPLKLKFKAKKAGKVELQTPQAYRKPDSHGRVTRPNMFYGEGIAGKAFFKAPGLYVACLTDPFNTLNATEIKPYADVLEPEYKDIEVKQTDTATTKNTAQAPEGTTYKAGQGAPEWATVAEDGTVTVKPGLDVEPGDYTVPVVVTYPDSSADNTVVKVKVKVKPVAELHDPKYTDVEVMQEGETTSEKPRDTVEGSTYAAGEGAPEWATVNADGTVTVKPDLQVKPGKHSVPVAITYPDKSVGNTTLNVNVTKKPDNDIHDPKYTDITVKQQDTETAAAPSDVAEGAQFAAGEGAPEWVTVNADGTVTVKPGLDVKSGNYTVPVKVTYPDKTSDNAELKVEVTKKPDNEIHDPQYDKVTVKQLDEETVEAPKDVAEGAQFAAGEGAPEWATVNADGTVTVKPGLDVKPGDYTVPVKVAYPDTTGDDTVVNVTVTVKPANEIHDPQYTGTTDVEQESTATVAAPEGAAGGVKFTAGEGAPDWATVNEDGSITVKPGLAVKPGDYDIPVVATYPDGSTDDATAKVTVTKKPDNEIHDPQYDKVTVKQLDEETVEAPKDVAEGAQFAAGEGAPEWATVNADGTVTVKPGLDVKPGDYTVPVKVTYPDTTGDDTVVNVTVTVKPANEIYDPSFEDVSVKQGETVTSKVPGDTGAGAKFTAGEGAPEWATVNPDGTVTLKPSKDVKPGNYTIPVVVTYPDGSTSTVELKVNVERKGGLLGSSGSSDGSSGSLSGSLTGSLGSSHGSLVGSSPLGYFFAALFGVIAIGAGLTCLYNWARAHGYVR